MVVVQDRLVQWEPKERVSEKECRKTGKELKECRDWPLSVSGLSVLLKGGSFLERHLKAGSLQHGVSGEPHV